MRWPTMVLRWWLITSVVVVFLSWVGPMCADELADALRQDRRWLDQGFSLQDNH